MAMASCMVRPQIAAATRSPAERRPDLIGDQCATTLVVIGRETRSWLWPVVTFTYMTVLAWIGALVTYQVGTALGW